MARLMFTHVLTYLLEVVKAWSYVGRHSCAEIPCSI